MLSGAVDPAELVALAERVARSAGALLLQRPTDLGVSTKSSPTDVVTVMDRASERLLVDGLLEARPDDGILGEEGGERSGASGVRWLLDPIDGTVNYLYGLREWTVSVAAEADGEVVAGVVHAPALGDTYAATLGGGARWNGDPTGVGSAPELAQTLLATGFGYDSAQRARQAAVIAAVLPRVRDIRRIGAASLDLCLLAAGRVDAYVEQGLQPWDLAAGGLIASEAGARVEGLRGAPAGEALVIATRPELFDALHSLLVGAGVDTLTTGGTS
ncbi:MAG: inositol monophosphatase family protein [Candidatus Nanopelagicales bacterium]